MAERILGNLKKTTDLALKKQSQEGLAKIFSMLGCKGVAGQIKAGRKVTGNAEFGIRFCVHDKIGPRVNVETMKFSPQTQEAKQLEEAFVKNVNKLLEVGGFSKLSSGLLGKLREKDEAFERQVKSRR